MVTPTKAIKVVLLSVIVFSTLNISAQAATFQTYVIDTYGGDALLPAVRQQLNTSRDGGTAVIDSD